MAVLATAACRQAEPAPVGANSPSELTPEAFFADDSLGWIVEIGLVGDRVVALDAMLQPAIHVVDLEMSRRLGSYGHQGDGPGEFKDPEQVVAGASNSPDEVWILDGIHQRLTRLSLQEIEAGNVATPETFLMDGPNAGALVRASDGTWFAGGWITGGRVGRYHADRNYDRTIVGLPPDVVEAPGTTLLQAYESWVVADPAQEHLAAATLLGGLLEIFDHDGVRIAKAAVPDPFQPVWAQGRSRNGKAVMALGPERAVRLEVLAVHVMGQQTYPQGVSLASLDLRGRSLAVPVSTGDGSVQVRNPFSHSDMLAIDPSGRYVPVIRRPKPASARALFTVERNDVLESIVDTIRVPYTPRPVQRRDVRAWAENLGAVERMVELGAFPSQAAGVNAVLKALGTPDYHPPIRNRGRGIVEDGVLFDSEGKLWLQVSDVSGRINDWIVISSDGGVEVSRVSVPVRARLLAVQANRVWAEARDDYGVPMVQVFELRRSGR